MFNRLTRLLACLSLCLLLASSAMPVEAQTGLTAARYFPETGHTVKGGFLEFFDQRGGAGIFGFPITDEFIEDGLTVQYFERARMEWHPELPPPNQIQLGPLGYLLHGSIDTPAPAPSNLPGAAAAGQYFAATGHNVVGPFLAFFSQYGGAATFGNPITEVLLTDQLAVQYFERARMEQDRSNPGVVRLGSIGQEWLTKYPYKSYSLPVDVPAKYFPDTGQFVRTAFLDFYDRQGGLEMFGEPISPVITNDDGIPVQYFQRARFEYHAELAPGAQVTLGKLGKEIHGPDDAPVPNNFTPWDTDKRYFSQTGHIVSNAFLAFFDTHGKETFLGFPISEATVCNGLVVQWFEKARLEYHPENPDAYKVQLGLIGAERYREVGPALNPPDHWFGKLWNDNPRVAQAIGKAIEGLQTLEMTEQYFENGFMLTWKGANRIWVLYEGGQSQNFPDTWRPGDVSNRELPVPNNKFEPTDRFGKIWWGLGGPGSKLGWATTDIRTFWGNYQKEERGFMVRIVRPQSENADPNTDLKWLYVIYDNGAWEIYEDSFDESYTVRPVEHERIWVAPGDTPPTPTPEPTPVPKKDKN